jgi:murein DD-endopeptidase MepM/ murein hydrolase activator NlpD
MDQSPHPPTTHSTMRSKFMRVLGVLFLLFCLGIIIHRFMPSSSSNYTKQTLSLPHLASTDKKAERPNIDDTQKWQHLSVRSGDSLSSLFKRAGLSSQTLYSVMSHNKHAKLLSGIKPNQTIQLLVTNHQLESLILPLKNGESLVIQRSDSQYISRIQSPKMTEHNQLATATVQGSLYGTAKHMNIPYKLIQQMTSIFDWQINFARDVRAGDQFTILYKAYYVENELVKTGDILAVTYTNRGKTYQAIRHTVSKNNTDYFTPEGTSFKKAFSRYPVQFNHISSMFSLSRMHPMLHYKRPHQGVDLAAPTGTPIHATGDGRIVSINRQNAYGNMIKIAHQNSYSSLYAHLLRFKKGLSQGDHVKRGEVIGYVGQTGLADGPHCHYEFHINHLPHNPSTVVLPRASPIPRSQLSAFKAEADKLLAKLKLYETASLATANKRSTDTA